MEKVPTGSRRFRFRVETVAGDCSDVLSSIVSSKLLEIVRRLFIRGSVVELELHPNAVCCEGRRETSLDRRIRTIQDGDPSCCCGIAIGVS